MRSRCCVQILVSHEINSTQLYSNQWCIHPDKYRYKPVMIWCLDSALNFMETRWLSHHFGKMPTTEQAKKPAYMQKKSIHPSVRPSILLVPTSLNPRNKLIPNVHAVTTIRFIRISRSQQHNFFQSGEQRVWDWDVSVATCTHSRPGDKSPDPSVWMCDHMFVIL